MTTLTTMNQKELDRYGIICRLIKREINGTEAARLICLSIRQTKRLKNKVKERGAAGLIHGNRNKSSNRRLPQSERLRIAKLLHKRYYDFGPTLAAEKLRENHRLVRDPKTIRQIMIDEQLWRSRKKKNREKHRSWRQRKASYGEMIQFDGSYEHWLEDRNGTGELCLLAAIDDATGQIIEAKFDQNEGVFPVFDFWRQYLEKHGKPRSIYLDKFSTYQMGQQVALENHDLKTQFQRAMTELRIEPIFANSPQAKGRVERLFNTLQDRLIKEMRLLNLETIEEANIFLKKAFIPQFNQRFAVQPRNQINLHSPLTAKEQKELNSILSRQTKRTVQNDFTISFKNQWYQLTKDQPATVCKKDEVIIEEHLDNSIYLRLRGKHLNYALLPIRPKRASRDLAWVIPRQSTAYIPPPNHPWRQRFLEPRQTVKV